MRPTRDGVLREKGIRRKLPKNGPKVKWRTTVLMGLRAGLKQQHRVIDRVGQQPCQKQHAPADGGAEMGAVCNGPWRAA
jgi:hypothetical protein